jgi:diadenylate cyclase
MDILIAVWRPLLEIIFIWVLIYNLFRFFEGTRAMNVLMGLVAMAVIFNIAKYLNLHTINWVLTKMFAVGVVTFLIIFQPELRRGLARIGQSTFFSGFLKKGGTVDELVQACEYLSRNRIGAIIAIERDASLKSFIENGIVLDARVSAELLMTLFAPNTPTHDGGVIIQNDRIAACGSLFPLSQNPDLARYLGTRHRAALGLTEETDSVCVVVSEERGTISIAAFGKLTQDLTSESLREQLVGLFKPVESKQTFREFLEKNWKSFRGEKPQ